MTELTKDDIAKGVVEGVRELLQDKELMNDFWESGYNRLVDHASNGTSQWIGKRFITWVVGIVFSACLVWYARSGIK